MNKIIDSSTNKKLLSLNKKFDTLKINWHLNLMIKNNHHVLKFFLIYFLKNNSHKRH